MLLLAPCGALCGMYLLLSVNERILLCLQLASYSQRTMNDATSSLFMYKKAVGRVGLDESGKEKAKLRGIGLVLSCVDLGQSLIQSLCAISPL
jgi:hypothetical protein